MSKPLKFGALTLFDPGCSDEVIEEQRLRAIQMIEDTVARRGLQITEGPFTERTATVQDGVEVGQWEAYAYAVDFR